MRNKQQIAILFLCFHFYAFSQRIDNSPYPVTTAPDTLFVVNINAMPVGQQVTVVTLQGLLAKTRPRIMVQRGATIFQRDLANRYGVHYDSSYLNNFPGLLNRFKADIGGYILCNVNDTTTNAAISICSPMNAIATDSAGAHIMDSLGIAQLYDVIGKGQSWAFDTFQNVYSHKLLSYQEVTKCTYLSDYSVFAGAYHFWDFPFTPLAVSAFSHPQINGAVLGWGDEYSTVYTSSQHGLHVNAADFASNLSTYSNFTVAAQQKNTSSDTTIVPGVHTVCFVMTDGDNIQWLTNDFATNTGWYGSPHRGLCNLGWTVSASLAELAPTILKYLYDSAATGPVGKDYFIAAPSGMGYDYPDAFQPLDSAAAITGRMMKKADLSILNIIGNAYQTAFMSPYLAQPNIDAIFYYTYSGGYEGLHGLTDCLGGKPVIGARYTMWSGFYSTHSLAQTLDTMPKDPHSPDGYSLVDVHVWDNNVDSVIKCISLLDSTIRVVTPDAFVKLFRAGTGCNGITGSSNIPADDEIKLRNYPNPFSGQTEITFFIPVEGSVELILHNLYGEKVKTILSGWQQAGSHYAILDKWGLAEGIYYYTLTGSGFSKTEKCLVVR